MNIHLVQTIYSIISELNLLSECWCFQNFCVTVISTWSFMDSYGTPGMKPTVNDLSQGTSHEFDASHFLCILTLSGDPSLTMHR